ncbi:MAG: MotA/TolQ/ExbB proton channel family protein [Thermoguttaceae bacterium]|nr:MotA/TolQ/ExbB proton channel family protein [Thermoguttaceae bacterium]MDW8039141.1 MotA/TolQ/ExbB proton channel family protein [Thermoguttaceae bacterium]
MVKRIHQVFQMVIQSPILWGALASLAFYASLQNWKPQGPVGQLLEDYFLAHPINYASTTMFFVGVAVLGLKALVLGWQRQELGKPVLPQPAGPVEALAGSRSLLEQLEGQPERQGSWLVQRIRAALEHVHRRASAEGLLEELKYLAEQDALRLETSYALLRVVVWAIPILGFLGTVLGLTVAVGKLEPEALEKSLPDVVAGLSVAFNTTAQALALTMVLMFGQFFVHRAEVRLLAEIDHRAEEELLGRFETLQATPEGHLQAVRRMMESLVEKAEQLVRRQAEIWQGSLEAAQKRWTSLAEMTQKQLQSALAGALSETFQTLQRQWLAAEQALAQQNHQHWERLQQLQTQQSEALAELQHHISKQVEILTKAVEATGQIARLEEALNRNLGVLVASGHFEQALASLTAAIHLLHARLGQMPLESPAVQLEPARRKAHVA